MNKLFFLVVTLIFMTIMVRAQENVVKVNPAGLLLDSGQFSYERVLNEKSALELSLSYTNVDVIFSNREEYDAGGLGAEAKYKKYFSRFEDAPKGWYGAPVLGFAGLSGNSEDTDGEEGKAFLLNGGVVFGYQLLIGQNLTGFALDFSFGLQYVYATTSGNIDSLASDGIRPRLGIALGYAW